MEISHLTDHFGTVDQGSYQFPGSAQFAALMEEEIMNAKTFQDARASYSTALDCVRIVYPDSESDYHRLQEAFVQILGAYKMRVQRLYKAAQEPSMN